MATPVSYHLERAGNGTNLMSFTAASDANAQTIAQSFSTLFNIGVTCIRTDSGANLGAFTPGSQGTTVVSVSNVNYSAY